MGRCAHGPLVSAGEFGADMKVELLNDGPVTLIADQVSGPTAPEMASL